MILKNAAAAQDIAIKPAEEEIEGTGEATTADTDGLGDLLAGMSITGAIKKKIFCTCTRKCATRKCPCLSARTACNELCHKYNNVCINVS